MLCISSSNWSTARLSVDLLLLLLYFFFFRGWGAVKQEDVRHNAESVVVLKMERAGVRCIRRLKLPANHCAQPPPSLSVLMGGADNLLSAPRAPAPSLTLLTSGAQNIDINKQETERVFCFSPSHTYRMHARVQKHTHCPLCADSKQNIRYKELVPTKKRKCSCGV